MLSLWEDTMSDTSLRLASLMSDDTKTSIVYLGRHSTPGRDGTTLSFDMVLEKNLAGNYSARIDFGVPPIFNTPEQAMDKLADWLSRAAIAIKERKTAPPIPNFQ